MMVMWIYCCCLQIKRADMLRKAAEREAKLEELRNRRSGASAGVYGFGSSTPRLAPDHRAQSHGSLLIHNKSTSHVIPGDTMTSSTSVQALSMHVPSTSKRAASATNLTTTNRRSHDKQLQPGNATDHRATRGDATLYIRRANMMVG